MFYWMDLGDTALARKWVGKMGGAFDTKELIKEKVLLIPVSINYFFISQFSSMHSCTYRSIVFILCVY
jgi:hypothetical protein